MARVRQAQASAVIAGAPLLPELNATLGASRQKLLRDSGYSGTDATSDNDAVDSFSAGLSASYEVDFWAVAGLPTAVPWKASRPASTTAQR